MTDDADSNSRVNFGFLKVELGVHLKVTMKVGHKMYMLTVHIYIQIYIFIGNVMR